MEQEENNFDSFKSKPACSFVAFSSRKRKRTEAPALCESDITDNTSSQECNGRSTRAASRRTIKIIEKLLESDTESIASQSEDEWRPPVHMINPTGRLRGRPRARRSFGSRGPVGTTHPPPINDDSSISESQQNCWRGHRRRFHRGRFRSDDHRGFGVPQECERTPKTMTSVEGLDVVSYFETGDDYLSKFNGEFASKPSPFLRPPRIYHVYSKDDNRGLLTLRLVRLNVRQIDQLLCGPVEQEDMEDCSNNLWIALKNFDFGDRYIRLLCSQRGLVVETPYQTIQDRREGRPHRLSDSERLGWDVRLVLERILLNVSYCPERINQNEEKRWITRKTASMATPAEQEANRKLIMSSNRIYSIDLREEMDRLASGQITSVQLIDYIVNKCNEAGCKELSSVVILDEKSNCPVQNYCQLCKKHFLSAAMLNIHKRSFHTSKTGRRSQFRPRQSRPMDNHNFKMAPLNLKWHCSTTTQVVNHLTGMCGNELRPWCFVDGTVNLRMLKHFMELLTSWVMQEPGVSIDNLQNFLQRTGKLAVLSKRELLELACALKESNYFQAYMCPLQQHSSGGCDRLSLFDNRPLCRIEPVKDCGQILKDVDLSSKAVFWFVNNLAKFDELF